MALIQYITPTQPAGSTNGLTMYKNGGQLAMRSRAYPLRNKSQAHIVPMNAIAILSMLWESPLTNADRIAWGNYAFATPLTDAYGNPVYVKGYAHFMRVNRPLLQHGLPLQLLAPTTTGMPTFTRPAMATVSGTTTVKVTITNSDTWATSTGSHMLMWISRPRSPRRRYPPEVYKPLGTIAGDTTTPPPINNNFVNPWGPVTTRAIQWLRPSIFEVSGRLSDFTNNPSDPNPKTMGTVTTPVNPCGFMAVCTYNLNFGKVLQGVNGLICGAMPGTPTVNVNVTNAPGFFWVGTITIGGFTYAYKYQVSCPGFGGHLPAQLFFQNNAGTVLCSWVGSMDTFGNGTMTAANACTLPTTVTVTQV